MVFKLQKQEEGTPLPQFVPRLQNQKNIKPPHTRESQKPSPFVYAKGMTIVKRG